MTIRTTRNRKFKMSRKHRKAAENYLFKKYPQTRTKIRTELRRLQRQNKYYNFIFDPKRSFDGFTPRVPTVYKTQPIRAIGEFEGFGHYRSLDFYDMRSHNAELHKKMVKSILDQRENDFKVPGGGHLFDQLKLPAKPTDGQEPK